MTRKNWCRILLTLLVVLLFLPSAFAGEWGKVVSSGNPVLLDAAPALSSASESITLTTSSVLFPFLVAALTVILGYALSRLRLEHAMPLTIITIIILFPFASADVTAALVSPTSIAGIDDFKIDANHGYRRVTDTMTVIVDVTLEDDSEISNDQVRFILDGTGAPRAGACNGNTCTFLSLELTLPGDHYYLAKLIDDSGNLRAQEFMHMYSDGKPPTITLQPNATTIGAGGQISIVWKVKDVRDVQTQCGVGIQEIKIMENDFAGNVLETISGSGECEMNGTYNISSTGAGEGDFRVCFQATDRFNQTIKSNSNCVEYSEDNEAPQAVGAALKTTDGSIVLTHFGPNNKSFMLEVNISGNVDPSTVKFDLTSFGLGNMTPTHSQVNASYHIFHVVSSSPKEESFSANIEIYGNDEAGNPITPNTISAGTIQWDNMGPKIVSIQSSYGSIGSTLNVGRSGNITATVTDSYITPEQIKLAFIPVSGGSSCGPIPATDCEKSGGNWECVWEFSDFSGTCAEGTYNITGDNSSRDLFGNFMNESITVPAVVDFSAPVLVDIKFENFESHDGAYGEEIVAGNLLKFTLYLNDSSGGVSALTNFSPIITTMPNQTQGSCQINTENDSDHVCVFPDTDAIDRPFPFNLMFNVTDAMGNTNSNISYFLDMVPFTNDSTPYWESHGVTCYPNKIDREVTTLSSQRMYCEFTFAPLYSGVTLLSLAMADCQNASTEQVPDYVQGFTLLQTENTSSPWLKIQLRSVDMDISELQMNCPFVIYSMLENSTGFYVVQEPQNISVPLTIQFFNQPLGSLDDNLQDKIDEAKDDAENGFLETISMLKTVVELATKVCNLWSAYLNIRGAFQLFTLTVENTETATTFYPPVAEQLRVMKEKGCTTTDAMDKNIEEQVNKPDTGLSAFCGYVNCKYLPRGDGAQSAWGSGYIDKWQEWGFGNLSRIPGTDQLPGGTDLKSSLNVKDNLILSLVTGCLPGIIYGIEKYRQILCMYSYCLNRSADYGGDATACKEMKDYAMCMFVFGEIVYALPWTALIANWLDKLSAVLSNPFAIIGTALSYLCSASCPVPKAGGSMFAACRLFYVTSMLSSALSEILNVFKEDDYTTDVDWCELMEGEDEGGFFDF